MSEQMAEQNFGEMKEKYKRATNDRKLWKAIIVNLLKGHVTQNKKI